MVQILSGLGKRALDRKDDHVVCSMSSPLRITFRLLHNDPTEVSGPAPAPHCSEIYMSVLDVQLQSSSQKLVLSFYDSLIFLYIYIFTNSPPPFHPQPFVFFNCSFHCLDIHSTSKDYKANCPQAYHMGSCKHYNPI